MKKILFAATGLFFQLTASAQLPGGTDIWVFDFTPGRNMQVGTGVNITKDNSGYDNQPAFSPSGDYLLFSSSRNSNQTDIYKYDFKTQTATPFCSTKETSEFSPSFVPGNKYISTVLVEKDSTQRLWRYFIRGGNPEVLFPEVDSVGYHCWFDESNVFFFVLTQPFSIIEVNTKDEKPKTVATKVGRCMQTYKSPQRKLLLYTQEIDSVTWKIKALNSKGEKQHDFEGIKLPEGCQDFVVTSTGVLLAAEGAKLYSWEIGTSVQWKEVADLSKSGLTKITRLALSRTEHKIAFVDNKSSN